METDRLHQFCTIVETGSLRKAADLLRMSHSGLSKSMKVFERDLGFHLFQTSGRGIVISDQGMKLYERSSSFFEELKHLMGAPENKTFIRIGSFEVFTSYFISELLKKDLADVDVEIHELVPGRLEEALLLNKVDLGITYEPIPRRGIEYVKITKVPMGVFAVKDAFHTHNALTIPFVTPVSPLDGAPSGVKGRDGWPDDLFKRTIRYRVDLMATGLDLVRQGLCAIFIPQFVADQHNEAIATRFRLVSIPLPKHMGQVQRDVYIVKRESTPEDRIIKVVAKALRRL